MHATRIVVTVWVMGLVLVFMPESGGGDVITFKRGGKKKCVILEETEESVRFVSSMGVCTMPRSRVGSIERQSDKVNEELKEEWERDRTAPPKKRPAPTPRKKERQSLRTYNVEVTKRRITIGGRAAGISSDQLLVSFVIDDYGVVKGSRLFRVTVISYKGGRNDISLSDFYALSSNAMRVDPQSLKGYTDLDASLSQNQRASGYVAFPTETTLKTMILKSDLAEFELDLETGEFVTKTGFF